MSTYTRMGTIVAEVLVTSEPDRSGNFICDGAADQVEINAALIYASVVAATWQSKVVLKGNFATTASITVPSYTLLEIQGRITLDADTDVNVISASSVTMVAIHFGYINGQVTTLGGIYFESVTDSEIIGVYIEHVGYGIDIVTSHDVIIQDNIVEDCTDDGIAVNGATSYYIEIIGNISRDHVGELGSNSGVEIETGAHHLYVIGNTCYGQTTENGAGIRVHQHDGEAVPHDIVIEGNICYNNNFGIVVMPSSGTDIAYAVLIEGNNVEDNDSGIYLKYTTKCSVLDNIVRNSTYGGIIIEDSTIFAVEDNISDTTETAGAYYEPLCIRGDCTDGVINGNILINGAGNGLALYDTLEHLHITNNLIRDNVESAIYLNDLTALTNSNISYNMLVDNTRHGIWFGGNESTTRFFGNFMDNNGWGPTAGAPDLTCQLPSITVPFVDGSDPQDSGYLIDVAAELARAFLWLPLDVQSVMRIRVYARAVDASATTMAAEFVIYGGADNEGYQTHNGSVANHPSTSSNFAANDVIFWTITEADVLALLGGDSVQVKVLHEAADAGGIETDAYFRTVTIEYI